MIWFLNLSPLSFFPFPPSTYIFITPPTSKMRLSISYNIPWLSSLFSATRDDKQVSQPAPLPEEPAQLLVTESGNSSDEPQPPPPASSPSIRSPSASIHETETCTAADEPSTTLKRAPRTLSAQDRRRIYLLAKKVVRIETVKARRKYRVRYKALQEQIRKDQQARLRLQRLRRKAISGLTAIDKAGHEDCEKEEEKEMQLQERLFDDVRNGSYGYADCTLTPIQCSSGTSSPCAGKGTSLAVELSMPAAVTLGGSKA